ncbi:hypothetical protein [Streptomyces sp. NPDC001508]|uniref:hypothetical protein n=1 Tax=Streptomyces sp. NPDC001508 TaxID=3154656 RepID=UPI003332176B
MVAGRSEPLRDLAEDLIRGGIHAEESGLAWYISAAHTDADVARTPAAVDRALTGITG